MAKNKKTKAKQVQKQKLSPARFMKEKARALPIHKCYITPDWEINGIATVIVSRCRPNGNIAFGSFLVDTFCLGVKDTSYNPDCSEYDFERMIRHYQETVGLEEVDYNVAHNLIYGAVSFAEDGGIEPHRDFAIAGGILAEDTDDVPLIEYEYGKNGKHYLVVGSQGREMRFIDILKRNLGDDFSYVLTDADIDDDDFYDDDDDDIDWNEISERMKKVQAETNRHPKEAYSYKHPEYPTTLEVKHQFIADELRAEKNNERLPDDVIDRILALPPEEAATDISRVVMYEIGRTYQHIEDEVETIQYNGALVNSVVMLTELRRPEGLDAVLEILRQNDAFLDYHFGDIGPDILPVALYACGNNNVDAIEALLNQPGLDSYARANAFEALAWIIAHQPERRAEIIEVMRRLLKSMVTNLPNRYACDGGYAGMIMYTLIQIKAEELIPEIRQVFATNCVDLNAVGDADHMIKDINEQTHSRMTSHFKFPEVHAQFKNLF